MKPIISTLALVLPLFGCNPAPREAGTTLVREFIRNSWDAVVRFNPNDSQTLIGLPYPYTVPCVAGTFQELYYWDTYFTCEGLAADGRTELAKNNVDDMLYLVDRFGYMPNGSRTWYLNRSQPPYLAMAVDRIFRATGDREWLARALGTLEREYAFWMTERMTPIGLNRYSSSADEALVREFVVTGGRRLGADFTNCGLSEEELSRLGAHFAAEAESGWDFNPRFDRRCEDFCPIDLNANLYRYERLFARFAALTGDDAAVEGWLAAAERRRVLIDRYCLAADGIYYDYDFRRACRSPVVSGAVFNLLCAGVPSGEKAERLVRAVLPRLEFEHGLAVCAERDYPYVYQWSYPNCWPPIVHMAVCGLERYGYRDEARRIAAKYVDAVIGTFRRTGNLWEKYDVRTGGAGTSEEYEMPPMLGWSAGVFVCACEYLAGRSEIEKEP